MRKQTPSVLNAIRVVKYWAHSELPSDVQLSPLLLEIVVHHVAKVKSRASEKGGFGYRNKSG